MRNKTLALGLGSNLGNPVENLRRALGALKLSEIFKVIGVSSIYESEAQLPDGASGDWNKNYVNAVVICEITQDCRPEELLRTIQKIETQIGRTPNERWAPRMIDIDILYWNSEKYLTSALEVPHRHLTERPFALLPLLQVWKDADIPRPDWSHSWSGDVPFNTRKSKQFFWPEMVGILNITPDSFSDGGECNDTESLQQKVLKLTGDGADIIEIGAESTRPGATGISAEAEFEKLDWALKNLGSQVKVSIDCRNPKVLTRLLETHRIDYLNDVTGFTDTQMQSLLATSGLSAFVMHSLSVPPKPELTLESGADPFQPLTEWWEKRSRDLLSAGVAIEKLIFDPGIGFGKTREQNWAILLELENFFGIRQPIMIGHSRKSFLNLISSRPPQARDLETALVTKDLNLAYVQYLRVHDIQAQVMALSC